MSKGPDMDRKDLDLFVSKAIATRDKDRDFNTALLAHGFVTKESTLEMVLLLPVPENKKKVIGVQIRR
jgi:hypothetical protein